MFERIKDRLLLWQATRVARRRGVTMIEYVLIAALVSIVAITLITQVGQHVNSTWARVNTALTPP